MQTQNRRTFLRQSGVAAGAALAGTLPSLAAEQPSADAYQVGAYYFGNYHVDPRNEKRYGKGWTEWELVKAARPRFPGHRQPRVPVWGYEDEADPAVMEKKIDAAANYGLDYWSTFYRDNPDLAAAVDRIGPAR